MPPLRFHKSEIKIVNHLRIELTLQGKAFSVQKTGARYKNKKFDS